MEDYRRGLAYTFGEGVNKNPEEAFRHFSRSADSGFAPAQYQLGVAYARGEGTGQDARQALYWYRKAAMQGHIVAQRNLGLMYLEGGDVEQDKIRALAWYTILAENGNAMDVRRRDSLVRDLSPEQIAQAHILRTTLQSEMASAKP